MNKEEFVKYTEKMNKNIANLLKDNEEELTFYSQLVRSFNNVCEKNDRLKKKINELIELNQMINNSDYVYSQDEITTKNLNILEEISE